jgi:5'-nucleotidase
VDGSDLLAVAEGYVSLTPLHLDLTNYRALADLAGLEAHLAGRIG